MTKPYLCGICGETDPNKFKKGSKGKCAACQRIYNKEKAREKDSDARSLKQVLRKVKSKRVEIKRFVKTAIKGIPRPPKVLDYGRKSLDYFKETVIANHGDIYLFDKSVYHGSNKEVEVGCKKHGNYFKVKAITLLRRTQRNGGPKKNPVVGSCPICREEYFGVIQDGVLDKCRAAHNNEYEYKNYVNIDTSFIAVCKKHGEFDVKIIKGSHRKCSVCQPRDNGNAGPHFKRVGERRYYICEIHRDVDIGKNRATSKGCPKCNLINNNKRIEDNFRAGLEKKFGWRYDVFVNEKYVEFRCRKHGTRTTYTRKEWKTTRVKNHCSECVDDDRIKRIEKRCKTILETEYTNFYEFIRIVDIKRIEILNVLTGKPKVVTTHMVLSRTLTTDTRYLLQNYMSYDEGKIKMVELGITSNRQYVKWHKRTKQTTLPANLYRHFTRSGEWVSHADFFGIDVEEQMSAGEKRIADYLKRKGIKYKYQKRYEDCRDKNTLPFDFYLPQYNTIIEFDGYQHYFEVKKFGSLKYTQHHDAIKNKYCSDNDINLLRIPYWELEDNVVEWTLDNELTRIAAENVAVKT